MAESAEAGVMATHLAEYCLLSVDLGGGELPAGVLLRDPASDRLFVRVRRDWETVAVDDEDLDLLTVLGADLEAKGEELGAEAVLGRLDRGWSNRILVSERKTVLAANPERTLQRLYAASVRSTVRPETHLPVYSLRAAAGKFLDNAEIENEDWVEAPEDLRLSADLFVAHVTGRSMEPRIPDGSLCVFRFGVKGSRDGRIVLAEYLGGGGNDRYTVKRYRSTKSADMQMEDGGWQHSRIRMEPLNAEFPAWDLAPEEAEKLRIIAEFVRVLF